MLRALNSVDEGLPGIIPLNRASSVAEEGDAAAASCDAASCPPGTTVMTGGAPASAFCAAASCDAELTAELGRPTVTIGMGDVAELCCIPQQW